MTYSIRLARPGEEMTIALQRRRMFAEMGATAYLEVEGMDERFADWLRPKLANSEYLGWFAVSAAGEVAGGAGLLIREGAPHHHNFSTLRGYVMNVYVAPEHRHRGVARQLMLALLDHCRANGFPSISLHASDAGRPLYESLGFEAASEMQISLV